MGNKVLIIGLGSIGKRHAQVLKKLGCSLSVLSQHGNSSDLIIFKDLQTALSRHPDYIIIANETENHYQTLVSLASVDYQGKILVEKPLFHTSEIALNPFKNITSKIYVGYVMRFHNLIQRAKEWLEGQKIYSINCYCGQFLPTWRPNTDYRRSYSAQKPGGGVLRDLSHELDYLQFLTGEWQSVVATQGHLTNLEIDTEDISSFLLKTERCENIVCQLNYWDHNVQRYCIINSEKGTCTLDFISNTLTINQKTDSCSQERNQMFQEMHINVLTKNGKNVASFYDSLSVLSLINGIEKSYHTRKWIQRK